MDVCLYVCWYFSEGYCTICFLQVSFVYLLYILCIGFHDCYWNYAEDVCV